MNNHRRSAFTLIELLLVLVLLVIMAALTWPTLRRPLETQRLRRAADQVRVEWSRAHNRAMVTGQPFVFRYSTGNNLYEVGPLYPADPSQAVDPLLDIGAAPVAQVTKRSTLPLGIYFTTEDALPGGYDLYDPDAAPPVDAMTWELEIIFQPDGTAVDALLLFENKSAARVELLLRGLTCAAQVGDVYTTDKTRDLIQ